MAAAYDDLAIAWDGLARDAWEALLAGAGRSALQQGWAYGELVRAQGRTTARGVLRAGGAPVGLVQMAVRRFGPLATVGLVSRGPVWLGAPDDAGFARLMRPAWRPWRRRFLLWTPEHGAAPPARQVMTGASTAWLDLRPDPAALRAGLHPRWRSKLRQGEAAGLRVERVRGGRHLDWLIAAAAAQARQRGYRAPPPAAMQALAALGPHVTLIALARNEPVGGVLIPCHGRAATYWAGITTAAGRDAQAHSLLLWQAMLALRAEGIAALDLGGLDTDGAAGVARFKLATGAAPVTLPGSFLL